MSIQWGEFQMTDVFKWQRQIEINPRHLEKLEKSKKKKYPFYGQSTINNGVIKYCDLVDNVLNNENGKPTILIHSNNQNVVYLETPFYLKDGHGATSVLQADYLNRSNSIFIISSIKKAIEDKFSYNTKATKIRLKNTKIMLPKTKDKKPNFPFMENFIRELELARVRELAEYLKISSLTDTKLTGDEKKAIEKLNNGEINLGKFKLSSLFDSIIQGARLRKEDQYPGDIPFIMAGKTNTGVVGYISNPVRRFKQNSLTIDIFGNVFYRNYFYGAGDDTGVYCNEVNEHSKLTMLYLTSSIGKALHGKYSYGNKLRSSRSLNLETYLPAVNNKPDYPYMETLISAVQKLVIADVVDYSDKKLQTVKNVIATKAGKQGKTKPHYIIPINNTNERQFLNVAEKNKPYKK